MFKAAIRTVIIIVAIVVLAQLFPALQPYQTPAIIIALVTGLFGFIARSLFVLLLMAAAIVAYFFLFH